MTQIIHAEEKYQNEMHQCPAEIQISVTLLLARQIVVHCRDTNVIALLLRHYHRMTVHIFGSKQVLPRRGNIFPFMKMVDHMPYDSDTRESIPAFHALTGSNTTSYTGRSLPG